MENEYLLDMRIKNNVLYTKIMSECKSIKEFAEKYNVSLNLLYGLLNFRKEIYSNQPGVKYVPSILDLLNKLQCELSDIVPADYEVRETNRYTKEINAIQMSQLSYTEEKQLLIESNAETEALKSEITRNVNKALSRLPPREERIIRELYLLDKTETELAKEYGCSRGNIFLIKEKALKHLKHPARSRYLLYALNLQNEL